eukprot:13951777-Alexandrium_andersonii.AAC.1
MRDGLMLMHFADEVGPGEDISAAWATFSGEAFHIFQNCRGLGRVPIHRRRRWRLCEFCRDPTR